MGGAKEGLRHCDWHCYFPKQDRREAQVWEQEVKLGVGHVEFEISIGHPGGDVWEMDTQAWS